MAELATKWQPVSDIDSPFESIEYRFQNDVLLVRMVGVRTLVLRFSGVVAVHFDRNAPALVFFHFRFSDAKVITNVPIDSC